MDYLETVQDKRTEDAERRKEEFAQQQLVSATKSSGQKVSETVSKEANKSRSATYKVDVQNDIASPKDINSVVKALDALAVRLKPESIEWKPVLTALKDVSDRLEKLPTAFPEMPEATESVTVNNISEFKDYLKPLSDAVSKLELNPVFDPKITVKPAEVNVTEQKIDIQPLVKAIGELKKGIGSLASNSVASADLQPLIEATKSTTTAINSLQFPVANYILPFKDPTTGKATQIILNSDGSLPTSSGSSSSGKATDAYGWSATSDDGTYKYFYFEDASLNYYIMRKHKTNKVATYTKGTGGYSAVYVSSSAGPSGSPTWDTYGATF